MAIQKGIYNYPVKTVSEARTVTEPEFQPDLFDDQHPLYVNLDDIRDTTYLTDLYFDLGYNIETKDFEPCTDYVKIIFSGHRGCGKSAELRRIYNELNKSDIYFTVLIDLEQEVEVGSFQYADFFSLLIHKMIEQLSEQGISAGAATLRELAKRLFETEAIETTTKGSTKQVQTLKAVVDLVYLVGEAKRLLSRLLAEKMKSPVRFAGKLKEIHYVLLPN